MSEPKTNLKDGDDDGDDDLEIDIEPEVSPLCTWSNNAEEHRRTFVFDKMIDPSYAPKALIETMDVYCEWLKIGRVAKKPNVTVVREPKEKA